ncbi:MAG: hypothetical protein MJE68_22395 [Proteobacteria bacterium]|nr:hypothetical protein [Pseudomonadota bacterium]
MKERIFDEKAKQKENERASEAILISAEQILNDFEFEEHNSCSSSPVTRTSPNSSPDASTSGDGSASSGASPLFSGSIGSRPGASYLFRKSEPTLFTGFGLGGYNGSGPGI